MIERLKEVCGMIRSSTLWEAIELCWLLALCGIFTIVVALIVVLSITMVLVLPILAVVFGVLFALDLFGVIGG